MSRCPSKTIEIVKSSDQVTKAVLPTSSTTTVKNVLLVESSSLSSTTATTTTKSTIIPVTSKTTTTTTAMVSSLALTSSSVSLLPSTLPLLCLFWFWGFLFTNHFSVNHLDGLANLVKRFLRVFFARIVQIFLSTIYHHQRHYHHHLQRKLTTTLRKLAYNNYTLRCCRNNLWFWLDRWKRKFSFRSRDDANSRNYLSWNYYWHWLWPCRWKNRIIFGKFICSQAIIVKHQRHQPRKKRRRKFFYYYYYYFRIAFFICRRIKRSIFS